MTWQGEVLVDGPDTTAEALVLTAPISFWGGVDPKTSAIADPRHPQFGQHIESKVLLVPETIGSSSAAAILLELVHTGRAPAALIMHEPDAILLLGLIVAREMGMAIPMAVSLERQHHAQFQNARVRLTRNGAIELVTRA